MSARWIKVTMLQLVTSKLPTETFKASRGWFQRFLHRKKLTRRKKTNKKGKSPEEYLLPLQRFIQGLRELLENGRMKYNLKIID